MGMVTIASKGKRAYRPEKLEGLWEGDWFWESADGVGLRFEGMPNDRDAFIRLLAGEGCHPNDSNRILSRITENGHAYTTVMSHLNFRWITRNLRPLGVFMTVVPPIPGGGISKQTDPFPEHLIPPPEVRWAKVDEL